MPESAPGSYLRAWVVRHGRIHEPRHTSEVPYSLVAAGSARIPGLSRADCRWRFQRMHLLMHLKTAALTKAPRKNKLDIHTQPLAYARGSACADTGL